MAKKLFKVKILVDFVVLADDDDEAQAIALDALCDDAGAETENARFISEEINSLDDLPPTYEGSCIPWGENDDDKTIKEFLEELNEQ